MLSKRRSISQDDELHPGACYRHIHASQVVQETYLTILVGTDQTDENHIAFLTLESVHRIDGDLRAERLEEGVLADELTEVYLTRMVLSCIIRLHMRVQRLSGNMILKKRPL